MGEKMVGQRKGGNAGSGRGSARRRLAVLAVLAVLAGLLTASVASGAPHPFRAQDPLGYAEAQGDFDLGPEHRLRLETRVAPRAPQSVEDVEAMKRAFPLLGLADPFTGLVPAPPAADELPPVEPPEEQASYLPDLAVLPAADIYLATEMPDMPSAADYLPSVVTGEPFGAGAKPAVRFGVTIANLGRHSLELIGRSAPAPDSEDRLRVEALQCITFGGPRVAGAERACTRYVPIGSMSFHAQHGHLHIDGLARYRLLRDRGGRPDTGPGGTVSTAEKVGFCLGDLAWLGSRRLAVDEGWYRECRHTTPHVPVTARQGISPSWGDTYGPGLPGQHLLLNGAPDGVYWIEVVVNPADRARTIDIHEATRANNVSYRKIRISRSGTVAEGI